MYRQRISDKAHQSSDLHSSLNFHHINNCTSLNLYQLNLSHTLRHIHHISIRNYDVPLSDEWTAVLPANVHLHDIRTSDSHKKVSARKRTMVSNVSVTTDHVSPMTFPSPGNLFRRERCAVQSMLTEKMRSMV